MRIISFLSIILIVNLLAGCAFAKGNNDAQIFALIKKKQWQDSYSLAAKTGDSALKKIVLSQRYLDPSCAKNNFEEISGFLHDNPYWPQGELLRLRAEGCINAKTDKQAIVNWFQKNPPITGMGHKYYALAANSIIKVPEKLKKIIKSGWYNGQFSAAEQKDYYNKFKVYLTTQDHIKKIDNHLWNQRITAAENCFNLIDANYKSSFKAQIAFIKQQQNAKSLFQRVPEKYYTPGLIYQYLNSQKNNLISSTEITSLIRIAQADKDYADRFWNIQSYIAREFIEKKKYQEAYNITSCCFADSAENKSNAEYLSGWLALRFLNKPKLALKHFYKFDKIVKTPMSKSRGVYWLARAYEADNNPVKANELYNLAGNKYSYTFYGQVALVELGKRKINLPANIDFRQHQESAKEYAKKNDVTRAAKIVSKHGSNGLGQSYIKSAINQAENRSDVIHVAMNINQHKNIHHTSWAAKSALQKHVFIQHYAYPAPYEAAELPIEQSLMYSIIRQESVFDQDAVSSANARGLMQLLTSTACDTAKKIATYCHIPKLTADPHYNIKLGNHYLQHIIEHYNGSYILAIASYNGGPHNVNKWLKTYGDPRKMKTTRDVLDWIELIPFYETRNYVQRVLENLQIYRAIIVTDGKFSLADDLLRGKIKNE